MRNLDLGGGGFAAVSDAQMQIFLTLAAAQLSEPAWGDCYDMAHGLLTAHLLSESTHAASGSAGPVSGASAGGLSVSYGGGTASAAEGYRRTRYGQMLLDLWDACGGGLSAAAVVGTEGCCVNPSGALAVTGRGDQGNGELAAQVMANTAAIATVQNDITAKASIESPAFTGIPTAPTPANGDDSNKVATTAWVLDNAAGGSVDLTPITTRLDALETSQAGQDATISTLAPQVSPAFSGVPTGPTAALGTNTTQLATTAFVLANQGTTDLGPLTARVTTIEGQQTTQDAAITAAQNKADANETAIANLPPPVDIGPLTARVTTIESDYATKASPAFTGTPTAPTAAPGENTTQVATTAFVTNAVAGVSGGGAPLASPVFTGNPRAPTPTSGDNDTSIATTAFVQAALPDVSGITTNAAAISALQTEQGSQDTAITAAQNKADANETAIANLPGPVDLGPLTTRVTALETDYAPLASPTFTGAPKAPTPAGSSDDTSVATTAFVKAAIPAPVDIAPLTARVTTLEGEMDATEAATAANTSALADKADLASPTFTGTPQAPSPIAGSDDTSIATTQWVRARLPDVSGIATNSAAITAIQTEQGTQNTAISAAQTKADANETAIALRAPLDSPALIGTPQAPTPPPADDSNRIVTTEWITNRAYAPIHSPAFNGVPTVPTPDPSDDSAQIASTEWVQNRAYAPRESPFLIGIPMSPTPGANPNALQIANVGWTNTQLDLKAPLASPTFTGVPAVPTAAPATNTTQAASTAFVQAALPDVSDIATNASAISALETSQGTQDTAIAANTAKVTNATHTGDVTGDTALTIAPGAVTLPKMAPLTGPAIIGRETGSGDPQSIGIGTGLEITGGNLQASGGGGGGPRTVVDVHYLSGNLTAGQWIKWSNALQNPGAPAGNGAEPNISYADGLVVPGGITLKRMVFTWLPGFIDVGDLIISITLGTKPGGQWGTADVVLTRLPHHTAPAGGAFNVVTGEYTINQAVAETSHLTIAMKPGGSPGNARPIRFNYWLEMELP